MHFMAIIMTEFILLAILAFTAAHKAKTCYSCENINCSRTSAVNTKTCLDPLDYCVTVFDKFEVIQKGCSYEIPESLRKRCGANTGECHKCNSDLCNNLGKSQFACIQCDSNKDGSCASSPTQLNPERCGSPTAPNSYCYVKNESGAIRRGCLTSVTEQSSCYADPNCLLCLVDDVRVCNIVDFTQDTIVNRL